LNLSGVNHRRLTLIDPASTPTSSTMSDEEVVVKQIPVARILE
jgi:hypothetical protein